MLRNWKVGLVMLSVGLLGLTLGSAQCAEKNESTGAGQDDAVRTVLMGLESAVGERNVDKTSALFADDVQFIDQAGDEIQGQRALRQRFEELFKNPSAPVIGIHPQSITFLADNVALVVGEVSRKQDQDHLPASRFSMVLVKKGNSWLIRESTETSMQSAQTENRLQVLNWLIGKWSTGNSDASAEMTVEWVPSKKFITSKCVVRKSTKSPETDFQLIGWDPQRNAIISWHFDNNGGFGNGIWTKQPNEKTWTVDVSGVGADGSNTTASNVFKLQTADEFSWQSVHRSLDGAPVADTQPITVHRVKR
jgi:uncharacterized protein (TIGR02246 family)